jgi:prepilin-type N-terminal cleavage/methylation domain-containing protein
MRRSIEGQGRGRPAFTMIELLVVISIIAILVTLGASAAFRVMAAQQRSNTQLLLNRINSHLQKQFANFNDKFRRENLPNPAWRPGNFASGTTGGTALAMQMANQDTELARVIHFKFRYKQWFPTSFAEVFSPDASGTGTYLALPAYTSWLSQYGITSAASSTLSAEEESAACLYMILQRGGETTGEGDKGMAGNVKYVNSVPIMTDGWGRALIFCRWPIGDGPPTQLPIGPSVPNGRTALNRNGAYTSGKFADPLDPRGKLTSVAWWKNAQQQTQNFQSWLHALPDPRVVGVQTIDLTPVVVSKGQDGVLGLDISTLSFLSTDSDDNLYSINPLP